MFQCIPKISAKLLACALLASVFSVFAVGQQVRPDAYTSQEVSEIDGIPVLVKHLPDWENRNSSPILRNAVELKQALGERLVIDAIEFIPGTEAVTADYAQGKLLIVEYAAPQPSIEADQRITAAIAASGSQNTFTSRIGNYNVVVFDAASSRAAAELMGQVKYEKNITWLGNNPFAISAERAFILTTSDIFMSTLMVIVGGAIFAILGGLLVGFVFFSRRENRRANMSEYSDAGGMTRLNLDGLTPDILPERLLGD